MEHFDEFENFWQDEFENFESEPRPEEWEKIRERLHPKRRILPIWWFATAAMLVGSGLFVWNGMNVKKMASDKNITINNKSENTDNQLINIDINNKKVEQNIEKNITQQQTGTTNIVTAPTTSNQKSEKIAQKENVSNIVFVPKADDLKKTIEVEKEDKQLKENTIPTIEKGKELIEKRNAIEYLATIKILAPVFVNFLSEKNIERVNDEPILTKPTNRKLPLKIVLSAGLSSNYRNITPLKEDHTLLTNVEIPNFTSINRAGWQANLGLQIPISKRLALRSGLTYQGFLAKMNYKLTYPEVTAASVRGSVTASGFQISDISYESEVKSEDKIYHTIGVQADIMYFFNPKNALSTGASIGRLVGGDTQKQKTLYCNVAYLHRFKKMSVEPFFRYHLKNYQTTDNYYTFQPFSFGVNVGF